jgi:hypothetical protein
MYCMFKFRENGEFDTLLEGRKLAVIITAGGEETDGADLVMETFRRLAVFSKCTWLGALTAANATDPATIRADTALVKRAREFGRRLAE